MHVTSMNIHDAIEMKISKPKPLGEPLGFYRTVTISDGDGSCFEFAIFPEDRKDVNITVEESGNGE